MGYTNTRRRRGRRAGCTRNQGGGGTQSYGFGADIGPRGAGLGAPEVVTQQYANVPRPGVVSAGTPTGLPFGSGIMRGGRYTTDVSVPLAGDAGVAAPVYARGAACEDPTAAAKVGQWLARGGAADVTMNPMLREQTAGYGFGVDGAQTGAGTPITIQVPMDARSMSPNCTAVKGGRRKRRTARRRAANRKRSGRRTGRRKGHRK